jgi:DNA-binding winged helix-turn-helix (wHTH) protein/tetratricopeptide (TPR) repeat protein
MQGNGKSELLRFGPFELDPASEEVRRSGLVLRLPPQPFRILLLLTRHAGEVVSRDDIHAAIWGDGTYVDFEHGINSAIRQIRFVLGDHAEAPRYVRTLPRRGYQFIGSVERIARPGEIVPVVEAAPPPVVVAAPPVPSTKQRRMTARISAIATAATLAVATMLALIAQSQRSTEMVHASSHRIAVLPFRRLGPVIKGLDERSFAEELRATIGRLPPAHVSLVDNTSRESALKRADVVIDGSIHQSEDGIRVIVSVADAASKSQLWSETFQRRANRQEGIAVEVAYRVMAEIAQRYLPPPRHEPALVTKASPQAVTLYRRARLLHSRSQAYDWMRTKDLYGAAVKENPRFAEAWSGLSDVWVSQSVFGPPSGRGYAAERAADCARRAIALQPANAEAHSTLGLIAAQRDYDLAAAEDSLRRATTADPTYVDARANLAMVLSMRGEADEALREFASAQQLDPAMLDVSIVLPMLYFQARRYEDARARYSDMLAIDPQSRPAIWGMLSTYIAQKNWGEAMALTARVGQVPIDGVPPTADGFRKVFRGLEPFMLDGRQRGSFNDYSLALYYTQLGEEEKAFALLHKAVDARVPTLSYIMVDPRMDALRGDPRFQAVIARMKLGRPPASAEGR